MVFSSDIEMVNAFCEEAMLNKHTSSWRKRRKESCMYANILIISKGYDWGGREMRCWWADFVGLEVFARIEFRICKYTKNTILEQAYPVRLTSTLIVEGRGITPDSFILV